VIGFDPPRTQGEKGGSQILDRILDKLKASFGSLAKVVTNDKLVGAVIATTDTKVYHGLGYPWTTWEVVDTGGVGVVYQSATVNPSPSTYIILQGSAGVSVTLRFV